MGLILLLGLTYVYVARRPLYRAAATALQPWLTGYNQESLNRYLQDRAAAGTVPQVLGSVAISGPLRVSSINPRYFIDAAGEAVYLTGSHTWSNLQDNGNGTPPPAFDYDQYLNFLIGNNHNFFRLWTWEQSRWTIETTDDNYWFYPETPYVRTGPGTALDGKPKFDLDRLNQAYFDRMRQRILAAGDRGIYVSIMLFDGWSVSRLKFPNPPNNPWLGHPFNAANNINGVNGDVNGDSSGDEVHTLADAKVLAYQQAYVRKVIDTVNDLDNVLYEVSNESGASATAWQYSMIDFIKQYESGKPQQHPVGMTAQWPGGSDSELLGSNADWISPSGGQYRTDPPANSGDKVIVPDTDHLWGIGGDYVWVWKSFTRGLNPIFMDCYDGAGYGVGGAGCNFNDPVWVKLRANLGYTRAYAQQVNLAAMSPRADLCSTGYCLANPTEFGAEFIVYQPNGANNFTVDLNGLSGSYTVEWLNPHNGDKINGGTVVGNETATFMSPFNNAGGAVLFLRQPAFEPTPTQSSTPLPATTTPTSTPLPTTTTPTSTPLPTATTPTSTPLPTATDPSSTPQPTATSSAGTPQPTLGVPPVTPTAYVYLPAVKDN